MNRPKCFDFGMDFIGNPEAAEIRQYVEWLERRVVELETTKQINAANPPAVQFVAIEKKTGERIDDIEKYMYFFEENDVREFNNDSDYTFEIYIDGVMVFPTPESNRDLGHSTPQPDKPKP